MMHALNPAQLRSLAEIAPGTILLTGETMEGEPHFVVANDDAVRSGIRTIVARENGNVVLGTVAGNTIERTRDEIREQTRAMLLEAQDDWTEPDIAYYGD